MFFQRQGAGGATLDTVTVARGRERDAAEALRRRGGRFKELALRPGQLARVRRDLARLPSGANADRGGLRPGGAQYLLRHDGRTLTGRQGAIAPAARPAIRRLDGYIDGIGVRQVRTDAATHAP